MVGCPHSPLFLWQIPPRDKWHPLMLLVCRSRGVGFASRWWCSHHSWCHRQTRLAISTSCHYLVWNRGKEKQQVGVQSIVFVASAISIGYLHSCWWLGRIWILMDSQWLDKLLPQCWWDCHRSCSWLQCPGNQCCWSKQCHRLPRDSIQPSFHQLNKENKNKLWIVHLESCVTLKAFIHW